jgi:Mg-chelatase subunit ChlD
MIRLTAPVWLVLVLPLWLLLRNRFAERPLGRRLRWAAAACLLLALTRPVIRIPAREGVVVVVADRSASMPADAARTQQEWLTRLEQAMPARSKLGVVAFAERASIEQAPQGAGFGGFVGRLEGHASDLAGAMDAALTLVPRDSAARLLVMSDGLHTGADPLEAAMSAMARGMAVDYRYQRRAPLDDTAIVSFEVPAAPRPGERVVLTAWVRSAPSAGPLAYRLERNGRPLAAGERAVSSGLERLQFVDTVPPAGVLRYTLTLPPRPDDPIPENNTAQALARVEEETLPLLCLAPRPDSGLVALLRRGGVRVEARRPAEFDGRLATLSAYSGVLIENVPAAAIGHVALAGLAAWVHELGGGVMKTGGRQAYGTGGYFKSPLDDTLPVSMELRKEHRKFSLAIMIVLDRSGSMAMPVGGGRTKMDLANIGSVQVLDMLSEGDSLGVLAVDSEPHAIVPLTPLAEARGQRGRILGIRSQGGGIFVYSGLREALGMLNKSAAGARHVILFADAADAEEPGDYVELLRLAREANITCSVVGLGTKQDSDAEFLRDVARRGGGELYFTDNADDIPRIFAQDTLAVTRQAFVEEVTPLAPTAGWSMLSALPIHELPPVGGYNLTYLRPGATAAILTQDEFKAPALAFWQKGAGRALCFTAEADGADAGPFANGPRVGEFYATCARWTTGESEAGSEFIVRSRLEDDAWIVDLHLDPDHPALLSAAVPELATLREQAGQEPQRGAVPFRWSAPYRLTARVPLQGPETLLSAIRLAGRRPLSLPPVRLPYNPEHRPRDTAAGQAQLQRLARATGGVERMELAAIWSALRTDRAPRDLTPLFALLAALIFLADIFDRRTGALSARKRSAAAAPRAPRATAAAPGRPSARPGPPSAAPAAEPPAPPPPVPAEDRPDPLREARRRANRRLSR